MTRMTLDEFIRMPVAQDYAGMSDDIVESMPEEDMLTARRIVVAYAKALGYSLEVYSTYGRQYRIDMSNGIGRVVLYAHAWTSAGAFVWCCKEIAKSVKARYLSELQVKIDLI